MADFFFWLSTLAFLVKEFLFAAAVAAIVIILAFTVLLEALKASVTELATLELCARIWVKLIAATIWCILDLATFFTDREAFSALSAITESKATVSINFARIVAHATLTADFVVSVAGPSAALPERTTIVRAFFASSHAVTGITLAKHLVPRVLAHVQVHVLLCTDEKSNASANNALFHHI